MGDAATTLTARYQAHLVNPGAHRQIFVGCSAAKRTAAVPLFELYTGDLYKLHVRYALLRWGRVDGILSAKHGLLLDSDEEVEPYDLRLPTSGQDLADWSERVVGQLEYLAGPPGVITVLAGAAYYEWRGSIEAKGWQVETPFAGLAIGKRKQALRLACEKIEGDLADACAHLDGLGLRVIQRGSPDHATRFHDILDGPYLLFSGTAFGVVEAVRGCGFVPPEVPRGQLTLEHVA